MTQLAIKEQERIAKEQERIAKEKEKKAQEELEERLAKQLYDAFLNSSPNCDVLNERLNDNIELNQKVYASFYLDYEEEAGCTITEICNRINAIHSQCEWMSDARKYVKENQLTGMDVGKVIYQKHIFYKYVEALEYIDGFLSNMRYCYEGMWQNSHQFSLKMYKNNPVLVSQVIHLKESGYSNVYRTVAEWVVENDKKASKEWEKRKDKYKDIVEFYEHYISEDYKPRK